MENYPSHSNEALLDLLSKGDKAAFTEIYQRYWKKVYVIAYNRLKEGQLAEDIAQDVFASLWTNREKVRICALENYLATAAKFMVLAVIRKKELARRYCKSEEDAPVRSLPIENTLHYKQILEIIHLEVEKLPEKCRIIFKHSRNEGMQNKEIAAELNISPKTVENQINKALKHLKLVSRAFMHFCMVLFF